MINTYSFLSLQNVFILIIKLRCVSCSEYSLFKEQQGPLWGCGSREWGSCPVFNLGPSLTAQGRTSCLAWKRRPIVASVVPANGPRGRKASLLGSMGTFHPVHTGLKGAVFKVMSSLSPGRFHPQMKGSPQSSDKTEGLHANGQVTTSVHWERRSKKTRASPGEKDIFAEGKKSWEKEQQQQIFSWSPRCYTENLASASHHAPLHPSCEQMWSSWCKTLSPSQGPGQRRTEDMPMHRYQGPPARRTCLLLGLKEAEAAGATQQPTSDLWSTSACALRRYLKIKYSLFS